MGPRQTASPPFEIRSERREPAVPRLPTCARRILLVMNTVQLTAILLRALSSPLFEEKVHARSLTLVT
jgi:hypothetical protein